MSVSRFIKKHVGSNAQNKLASFALIVALVSMPIAVVFDNPFVFILHTLVGELVYLIYYINLRDRIGLLALIASQILSIVSQE